MKNGRNFLSYTFFSSADTIEMCDRVQSKRKSERAFEKLRPRATESFVILNIELEIENDSYHPISTDRMYFK